MSSTDKYTIEPTGRTVQTPRAGEQDEYRLLRNGVVVAVDTRRAIDREAELRERTGRNPLAGIGGQIA